MILMIDRDTAISLSLSVVFFFLPKKRLYVLVKTLCFDVSYVYRVWHLNDKNMTRQMVATTGSEFLSNIPKIQEKSSHAIFPSKTRP